MITKTQFKHQNNKNTQPKKDNKKAKRVLLLLIITIIFSFILTVANTLTLFVHVFKDKEQETFSITTQEQRMQTIAQYEDGDIVVDLTALNGINYIAEVDGNTPNIFTLTDRFAVLIDTDDQGGISLIRSNYSNTPSIALGNISQDIAVSGVYKVFEGYVVEDTYLTVTSYDYAYSFPLSMPNSINVFYEYDSYILDYGIHITVTLDYSQQGEIDRQFNFQIWFEWENSENDGSLTVPYFDWTSSSVPLPLEGADIGHHIGYGFSLTDFYLYANSNANENIAELRRQIQQLQNSTQQQVQDAYQQGRQDGQNIGYNNGYQEGLNDANTYTFSNVIGALIDGPVNAVMSLFDFEVLGVNLRGFFLSLITCAIVIAIIKIFM